MSNQKLPDFEGMESNEEYEALPDTFWRLGEPQVDETPATEPSPFKNEEDWVDTAVYTTPRRLPRRPNDLAANAAHSVWKWAQQATAFSRAESGFEKGTADSSSAVLREDRELMNMLARMAASTESRSEAASLVAALTPLAIRPVPQVYCALWPVLPALVKGMVGLTVTLHHPTTRLFILQIPVILEKCVTILATYLGQKRPLTQELVTKVLARQTELVIRMQPTDKTAAKPRTKTRNPYQSKRWQNGHNKP